MSPVDLFATPVGFSDLPDMESINRQVTAQLIAESQSVPSVHRSNVGSWHSPNLAMRQEPHFRDLINCIRKCVIEFVTGLAEKNNLPLPPMRVGVHAWAMVMRNGDYTIPHNHSEVHWGTVYYTDAGDADLTQHPESGALVLMDPRQGARPMPGLDLTGSIFAVSPKTGRLAIFPGWLVHYVHSYRGNRPRVAISCNCMFEPVAAATNERRHLPVA